MVARIAVYIDEINAIKPYEYIVHIGWVSEKITISLIVIWFRLLKIYKWLGLFPIYSPYN